MKKVLITLALLLPMVVSADPVEIDGIFYNLIPKGEIAEVTSNPSYYEGIIEIPSSVIYEDVNYDVTSIGSSAFSGCRSLTSVTIPNSVTRIGKNAFNGCSSLINVAIPDSVTLIADWAFAGCSGLKSITIPTSVTSIGSRVFSDCSGLTSVIIPNSVTSIGDWSFCNCSSLTTLTIPNSVTSIGGDSFIGCSSLTSITIPNSVTIIESMAFADCPEIADVYCDPMDVPNTESNCFDGSYIEYATLHVPVASMESYRTIAPWSSFQNFVASDVIVEVDGIYYRFKFLKFLTCQFYIDKVQRND